MIVRRIFKLSLLSAVVGAVGMLTLFSAAVYTFNALSDETRIAEVRFDELGPRHYRATLTTGDHCAQHELEIFGDQWRIDAEFVKWKYWALLLGLDSQYRLDRFEGRYRSAVEQNSNATLAHELAPITAIDVVSAAKSLGRLNFLVDASYGSSTYQEIDTARIYGVFRTQTGIITRSERKPEHDASVSTLVVEVSRGCGADPGPWESFVHWADATLVRIF